MAGKGGGAWKVAYADFVTAMMAFFLVMWITSQDQKIKEAIQHYFVTPMGYVPLGVRNPASGGGAFESMSNGNLPDSQAVSLGRGRTPHSDDEVDGRHSKLVSDWLHADAATYAYWKENADRIRAAAAHKSPNNEDPDVADAVAADRLARMLSAEMHQRMPLKEHSLYRDLLIEAMSTVNWEEVAEDLISE